MSIKTPQSLPTENVVGLSANDLVEHYNSLTLQNEKIKFMNMFLKGLYLNNSRIAMKELPSGTLSTTGWWTIAESDGFSGGTPSASFRVVDNLGEVSFTVAARESTSAKTHDLVWIKYDDHAARIAGGFGRIDAVRIAKSDTIGDAGFKVQVNISASTQLITQIFNNTDIASSTGFTIITPTQTDIGLCPDGSAATFLEAGEEFVIPVFGTIPGTPKKNSSTQVIFTIPWSQITKQGSSISFDFVNSGISLRDGTGTTIALPETDFTLSAPIFRGELVYFIYTATVGTPFSGLNNGPLVAVINTADMTITIG